ncbi:hypothetical protein [Streptomyces sp. PT12]|uniref:hypothetical protein n=1 Tax=Streptomyces sp. PT12 TaxID=1510197 RepID=UPI000DE3DF83|nr:hypothetical protein [Streptomyces sp. PT12]RBM23339.1 hypothetical protein DEH69_03230 [Streptomyces sp. PT12]
MVARRAGRLAEADEHFARALAWNERLAADYGVPFRGLALPLAEAGFVAELRGDAERARALHTRSLAVARELGDPRAAALATEGLAGAASLVSDHQRAAQLLTDTTALRTSVGNAPAAAVADPPRAATGLPRTRKPSSA